MQSGADRRINGWRGKQIASAMNGLILFVAELRAAQALLVRSARRSCKRLTFKGTMCIS